MNETSTTEILLRGLLIFELILSIFFALGTIYYFLKRISRVDLKDKNHALTRLRRDNTVLIGLGFLIDRGQFLEAMYSNIGNGITFRFVVFAVAFALIVFGLYRMFSYQKAYFRIEKKLSREDVEKIHNSE